MWATSATGSPPAASTRSTSAGSCATRCPTSADAARPGRTCSPRATPRRTPALVDVPEAGLEVRQRLARAVPAPRRRPGRVAADQGHRGRRGGDAAQGLRRERHDRRPRPQRPRARLPAGHRRGRPRCAPSRSTPGWSTSSRRCRGGCAPACGWARARSPPRFPPGSVIGCAEVVARCGPSPSSSRSPRGPYCGAVGWVDADAREADLAVGIRTFWADRDEAGRRWLRFGTGAGITWDSDPGAGVGARPSSRRRGWSGWPVWRRVQGMSDDVRVWVNGALVGARRAPAIARPRPRGDRRRRRVRDLQGRPTGEPFALTRHLRRLDRSLAGLGLPPADHAVHRRGRRRRCSDGPRRSASAGCAITRHRRRRRRSGSDRGDAGAHLHRHRRRRSPGRPRTPGRHRAVDAQRAQRRPPG